MALPRVIKFNGGTTVYKVFDNFVPNPCPISLKSTWWPSSEHYFQAQKFAGTPHEDEVRQTQDPFIAKQKGRTYPLRDDWEQVKEGVMRDAVYAKFSQHEDLKKTLLSTNDAEIIEDAPDQYWGNGGNGSGKNRLGVILVQVREELKKAQTE